VVSDSDELELAKQLQKLEDENREISGDEDSQEGSDGDSEESGEEEEGGAGAED
jgi:translation initiation factor 2 subunit 1